MNLVHDAFPDSVLIITTDRTSFPSFLQCPQAEKNSEKMEKAEILELTVNFLKLARSRRINGKKNN